MSTYAASGPRAGGDPAVPLMLVALAAALILVALLTLAGAGLALVAVAAVVVCVCAVARPAIGVYGVTLAAAFGDIHLTDPNNATGALLFKSQASYGINFTPTEIVLICGLVGLLARLALDPSMRFRAGSLLVPILLLSVAVSFASLVGIARGADFQVLRQEVRGLFYVPIVYLLITHFFTRREQLIRLMMVFVIAVNVMAVENIYRYYTQISGTYKLQLSDSMAFAHENSLLAAAAIILVLARFVWSKQPLREWKSLALIPIPLVAMLVMHRRAGLVALDGGVALLCLVLLREKLHTFLMFVPMALLAFGLIIAVTWNRSGSSGELARAYRSATGTGQVSARDLSSDLYRQQEEMNVRMNIQADPVVGKGFGRPYTFYISVVDLSANWPLWNSVPHNSVLWFWLDAGMLGFTSLAVLFAAAMMRAMQLLRSSAVALKPYAFSFGAIIFMFFMYSWVDLGLITPRTLTLFALALGGLAAMGAMESRADQAQATGRDG